MFLSSCISCPSLSSFLLTRVLSFHRNPAASSPDGIFHYFAIPLFPLRYWILRNVCCPSSPPFLLQFHSLLLIHLFVFGVFSIHPEYTRFFHFTFADLFQSLRFPLFAIRPCIPRGFPLAFPPSVLLCDLLSALFVHVFLILPIALCPVLLVLVWFLPSFPSYSLFVYPALRSPSFPPPCLFGPFFSSLCLCGFFNPTHTKHSQQEAIKEHH